MKTLRRLLVNAEGFLLKGLFVPMEPESYCYV